MIGSCLADRSTFATDDEVFRFKHHCLLCPLYSEILCTLLLAIHEHCRVALVTGQGRRERGTSLTALPLKIYSSTQNGRQYLLAFFFGQKQLSFLRLDHIQEVSTRPQDEDW